MNTSMNLQRIPAEKLKPAKYNPSKGFKPGDPVYEKIKRSLHDFGCGSRNLERVDGEYRREPSAL
jgi:hypothetical protein